MMKMNRKSENSIPELNRKPVGQNLLFLIISVPEGSLSQGISEQTE